MEINNLKIRSLPDMNPKLADEYADFGKLIQEMQKKYIPSDLVMLINLAIEEINSFSGTEEELLKVVRKVKSRLLSLISKELSLVTKNYYRNVWRMVGMVAFGIPIGLAFASGFGNMALMAIGLPLGLIFGMLVGTAMDKKAYESGKQLDIVIKY